MAAHVYSALKDVAEGKVGTNVLAQGLTYAAWAGWLEYPDWHKLMTLAHTGDTNGAVQFAQSILPAYEAQWQKFGQPMTNEDWARASLATDTA